MKQESEVWPTTHYPSCHPLSLFQDSLCCTYDGLPGFWVEAFFFWFNVTYRFHFWNLVILCNWKLIMASDTSEIVYMISIEIKLLLIQENLLDAGFTCSNPWMILLVLALKWTSKLSTGTLLTGKWKGTDGDPWLQIFFLWAWKVRDTYHFGFMTLLFF